MIVTVFLVKYEGGWVEVGGGGGTRREAKLELAGVGKKGEAIRIATALLRVKSQPSETVVALGVPLGEGGPTDYGYSEGDRLSVAGVGSQVVHGVTVTEDDEGKVNVVPELQSPLDIEAARVDRVIKHFADGSAEGSTVAGPARPNSLPTSGQGGYPMPPFSIDGLLSEEEELSPPWTPTRPILLIHVDGGLRDPGFGGSIIGVYVSESLIGSFLIDPGKKLYARDISPILLLSNDTLQFGVLTAGAGAAGLTIQPKASLA